MTRPRKRVFSRGDDAVLSAAERWAEAMGPYTRELTPEAADVGAAMSMPGLPGRDEATVRAVFRKVAARQTQAIEARRVRHG